jgi:hypothetical protein
LQNSSGQSVDGPVRGPQRARDIYDKAKACADFFQIRELLLAALSNTPVGKVISGLLPDGFGRTIPFDAQKAKELNGELATSINQFIQAVNTEIARIAARSGRRSPPLTRVQTRTVMRITPSTVHRVGTGGRPSGSSSAVDAGQELIQGTRFFAMASNASQLSRHASNRGRG